MKMWHALAAVSVGAFAIMGGIFMALMLGSHSSAKQESPHVQAETSAPEAEATTQAQPVEVTIQGMADDIRNNAAKVKKKYMGKYLKIVGGEVHAVNSDADSIMIGTSFDSPIHFFCNVSGNNARALKEQIADLNIEQKVIPESVKLNPEK